MTNVLGLSEAKFKALIFFPSVTSPLSVLGSSLVLTCIVRHEKSLRFRSVYHRLMTGLSVLDILFSVSFSFGPFLSPSNYQELTGNPWAKGSIQTCAAQGFFVQLGYLSYGYSMFLTLYFVLTIRYNLRERFIATYIEPCMHFLVLGFGLITAIVNVALEYANPGLPTCWVSSNPPLCGVVDDIPCIRGEGFKLFARWVILYPSLAMTFTITVNLAIVLWTVSQRRKLTRRFVFEASNDSTGENNTNDNNNNNNNDNSKRRPSYMKRRRSSSSFRRHDAQRKMDNVVTQCLLYGSNFLFCNFWMSFQSMLVIRNHPDLFTKYYFILLMTSMFFPLQGFFNCLIFFRPRYHQWRRREPDTSRLWAVKNAVWNPAMKQKHGGVVVTGSTPGVGGKDDTNYPIEEKESGEEEKIPESSEDPGEE